MPSRIPESLRWMVLEKWMLGYPRILIANECHISTGAVSSIAAEWKYTVGLNLANLIRGIGVTLRKSRMSPAQCMTGLRVANLVDRIGIDEDSIEAFLSDVYTRLQEAGVNPKHIARYVEGLLSLMDGGNNNQQTVISLHDIDRVFERKRQDKIKLEEEYKVSETKVLQMQQEASLNEKALTEVLLRKNKVELDIKWKSELVDELRNRELTIDDLFGLIGASQFFKERGYNVAEMFMTFSSYKKMEGEIVNQQKQLAALNKRMLEVEQESQFQEELLAERRLKNSELDKLKEMGFGLGELRTLRNLANEMAAESGKSTERGEAVKEFISDIENHLHDYLQLRNKVSDLNSRESIILTFLSASSRLGNTVSSFLSRKPTENAIKDLIEIIEGFPISESAAADSVTKSAKEREKTVQSATKSDSIEPNQRKEEKTKSGSQVQQNEVYIPSPFSEFAQPSFIHPLDEHDLDKAVVRDQPKKKHDQTKEVEPNGKAKIKW